MAVLPVAIGISAGIALIASFAVMMPTVSRLPTINVECMQRFDQMDVGQAILRVTKVGKPFDNPEARAYLANLPSVSRDYIVHQNPILLDAINKADMCYQKRQSQGGGGILAYQPLVQYYAISLEAELARAIVEDAEFGFQRYAYPPQIEGQTVESFVTQIYIERGSIYNLSVDIWV